MPIQIFIKACKSLPQALETKTSLRVIDTKGNMSKRCSCDPCCIIWVWVQWEQSNLPSVLVFGRIDESAMRSPRSDLASPQLPWPSPAELSSQNLWETFPAGHLETTIRKPVVWTVRTNTCQQQRKSSVPVSLTGEGGTDHGARLRADFPTPFESDRRDHHHFPTSSVPQFERLAVHAVKIAAQNHQ